MQLNYGINTSISVHAPRPMFVDSATPIGVVMPFGAQPTLTYYDTAAGWKAYLETQGQTRDDLPWITADAIELQGVHCKIIVAYVPKLDDASAQRDAVIDGLELLQSAPYDSRVLDRPDLIIVPMHSHDLAVAAKMDAVAAKLRSTGIVDVNAPTEADILEFVSNFGTQFLHFASGPYLVGERVYPASALEAGAWAYWDAGGDAGSKAGGWSESHSNRVVRGVTGAVHPIEYFDGIDCAARRLRQHGVSMIVHDQGWRTYGYETTDLDPTWQPLDRVRTFWRWARMMQRELKWARDRNANQLVWAKVSCAKFFDAEVANGRALGYRIYLDSDASNVSAGQFKFVMQVEDTPSIRELDIELQFVNDYDQVLIDMVNKA